MDGMLSHTRALKKRFISKLNTPINYKLQHVDDPEGDGGYAINMIAKDIPAAKRMAELLGEVGLGIGTVYNPENPDTHIYAHWDPILDKISPTPAGYPWKDPAYKGNIEYTRDMCPNTLDNLQRCLRINLNIKTQEINVDEFAEAVNYADKML
jgi:hypothetical protein